MRGWAGRKWDGAVRVRVGGEFRYPPESPGPAINQRSTWTPDHSISPPSMKETFVSSFTHNLPNYCRSAVSQPLHWIVHFSQNQESAINISRPDHVWLFCLCKRKVNNHVVILHYHILIDSPSITKSTASKFIHLYARIDSYKFSFFPRAIRLWDSLPHHVIQSDTFDSFKHLIML